MPLITHSNPPIPAMSFVDADRDRDAAAIATDPTPPDIDGYTDFVRIGQGGMGVVWKARQMSPARDVAVKVLNSRSASIAIPDAATHYQAEINHASWVTHPGVASVYAGGIDRGVWYCVMQYVDGTPLSVHARDHLHDDRAKVNLIADVLDAVQAIHQKRLIHGDIKPANILVAGGRPIIVDFGLARNLGVAAGRRGQIAGTPGYMSPEQARGENDRVDTTSDLWSVGCVLYELLTGRLPRADTVPPMSTAPGTPTSSSTSRGKDAVGDVLHSVDEGSIVPPRTARPDLQADLAAILVKALAPRQEDRYPNAGDMAADLRNWLTSRPVRARRPTRRYVASRWLFRNRRGVSIAALMLAVLLTTATVSYRRVTAARDDAVTAREQADQQRERATRGETETRRQLARARIAQGDAAAAADRWVEARELYEEALSISRQLGDDGYEAQLALAGARPHAPKPVFSFRHQSAPLTALAISPDGKLAYVGDRDGNVALWDVAARQRRRLVGHFPKQITAMKVSNDGRTVLIASDAKTAGLFAADTLEPVRLLTDVNETLLSATWSPDDKLIGTGGMGNTPKVWSSHTGQLVKRFREVGGHVTAVDFDQTGKIVYAGDTQATVNVCNMETGGQRGVISPEGTITAIAAGRGGNSGVMVASSGRQLRIWVDADLRIDPPMWQMSSPLLVVGHQSSRNLWSSVRRDGAFNSDADALRGVGVDRWLGRTLTHAAMATDSETIVVATAAGTIDAFALTPASNGHLFTGGAGTVTAIAISPDGLLMARATDSGGLRVHDIATGRSTCNHWLGPDNHAIAAIFSPDSGTLYVRTTRGELRKTAVSSQEPPALVVTSVDHAGDMAWLKDGRLLAQGGSWLTINDVQTCRELRRFRSPAVMSPGFRLIDNEGTALVFGTTGYAVRIDLETGDGRIVNDAPLGRSAAAMFDEDGNLFTGSPDGTFVHWNPTAGKIFRTFAGHTQRVTRIVSGPPGTLITASEDGTIGIWRESTGEWLQRFRGRASGITTITYLAEGRLLATGQANGDGRVWRLPVEAD